MVQHGFVLGGARQQGRRCFSPLHLATCSVGQTLRRDVAKQVRATGLGLGRTLFQLRRHGGRQALKAKAQVEGMQACQVLLATEQI